MSPPPLGAPPLGPAAPSAGLAEHEQRLKELLSGGTTAALPVQATDDPEALLDMDLYGQLTGGSGRHKPKQPQIRFPKRMSDDQQRAAEALKPQFRRCYTRGLQKNPNLQGRVVVNLEVGASGALGAPRDAGSDLPDSHVVRCILSTFASLSLAPAANRGPLVFVISFAPGA